MKEHRTNPIATILAISVALAMAPGKALAQDQSGVEPRPIDRKLATHLIAEFFEIAKNEVTIAFVISGKFKRGAFESDRAAEVTYIKRVVEDGRRTRAVHCITFLHDEELGWFLEETVEGDGRTYIDICSEHQGQIRID